MTDFLKLDLVSLAAMLRARHASSLEITEAYLKSIEENEPRVGAYITVDAEGARLAAKAADRRRAAGAELSLLDGIPCAIKDNILVSGLRSTCGSRMLENFLAPYDATVVERLRAGGAVLLGKLNLDEFAMGSACDTSAFGVTRNPHDTARVPGGSSGGSAAAVAASEALFTLGTDTGGSIRLPAAYCGVVGMKPTNGLVSRYGAIGMAPSMDQVGPITKSVRDNAVVLSVIAGKDTRDATTSLARAVDYTRDIGRGVKGLRIALPRELFTDLSPDVERAVRAAIARLEAQGACLEEISIPSLSATFAVYSVIVSAEASSTLARFDGVRYGYRATGGENIEDLYRRSRSEGFGKEVKSRILFGTYVLSAGHYEQFYHKAQAIRARLREELLRVFEKYDAILSATTLSVAPKWGAEPDPVRARRSDTLTIPANLAGLPALSLPCGRGEANMPIGLQLLAPAFSETLLYRIAAAVEEGGGTV